MSQLLHISTRITGLCLLAVLLSITDLHAQTKESQGMTLNQWLIAGPVSTPLPAFHEKEGLKEILTFDIMDWSSLQPQTDATVALNRQSRLPWKIRTGEALTLVKTAGAPPSTALAACYIDVARWTSATLNLHSPHLLRLFVDGAAVAVKESSEAEGDPGKLTHKLELTTGSHLLLVRLLADPENSREWTLSGELTIEKGSEDALNISTTPGTAVSLSHILNSPHISGVSLSADGALAAITVSERRDEEKSEIWLELHRSSDAKLLSSYRGSLALSRVSWAPKGRRFSYTDSKDDKTTLWLVDLSSGNSTALLRDINNFSGYSWSPDGRFIVYGVTVKAEADKRGVQHLTTPRDRWPGFRDETFLYLLDIASGVRQPLTAGKLTTDLQAISPDGSKLLFTRTVDDFSKPPYTRTTLSMLDLQSLAVDSLGDFGWLNSVSWSPDGKQLLFTGSAYLFGDLGVNVPEGRIANSYDAQAFLYSLASGKATAITRDFDPSIDQAIWRDDKVIHFSVTEREYQHLYAYTVSSKRFKKLDTGVDALGQFALSGDGKTAIYYGTGVSTPSKAWLMQLPKGKTTLLLDPAAEAFQQVSFGKVEPFSFVNKQGTTIEGRIYYPPGFDPQKKYPALVHYYGGTVPVSRSFGGRYPNNYFAANGYVVYVLQPSGAIGYGQAFSSLHVNDWGKIVAAEIIQGTGEFLRGHPFVDASKVGCIGASYGGFMTMLLTTKTDLFASAISHAGISSLSSYWGEGNWGYLYNSVAAANSFPWNNKELYVDQSPLFNADKVTTPLLLLSGDSDTNVPRGESDQFFLALKLLGKEVDYVRVEGQDHHILDYKKRVVWQHSIIAWFDRWLKEQPEWWSSLYEK